jgi:transposase
MNTPTLGLDMAKQTFTAALWFGPKHSRQSSFENTRPGYRKLSRWLRAHFVGAGLRVGVESTSTYADGVVEWLYHEGHEVYLLNPERTAFYARSLGQRNKTDPADAVTIAAFVATHEGTPWQPLSPEQKKLRSLTRTRHQLTSVATELSNQLRTASEPGRAALQAVLHTVREQIAALVRQIKEHLRQAPTLARHVSHLITIKGIALITAATIVAELPPITPDTDPRAICGWAGLTPRRFQSGQTEWRSRLSRKGNQYLRDALYMPALVAKRHNPLLKTFAQRLAAAGKSHPAILGAVSHKMLRIAVGLLRSDSDFDPHWSFQKT